MISLHMKGLTLGKLSIIDLLPEFLITSNALIHVLIFLSFLFSDLDENLQKAFHKYLEIRGIKPSTTNFLQEYMINKDSKEYLGWLKNLKKFIEKWIHYEPMMTLLWVGISLCFRCCYAFVPVLLPFKCTLIEPLLCYGGGDSSKSNSVT